jgi:hypothetical protein
MDFRTELAKWGYNKGNSIDVEILVDEILPSLFSQQERSYSEEDLRIAFTEGHDSARMKGSYKSNGTFEEDWILWFEQFKKKEE